MQRMIFAGESSAPASARRSRAIWRSSTQNAHSLSLFGNTFLPTSKQTYTNINRLTNCENTSTLGKKAVALGFRTQVGVARGEAERGEGRRGREALEDAVEVAGVAEVFQPRGRARAGAPRRRRRRWLRGRGHHRLRGAGAAGVAPPRDSTRPPSSSSAPRSAGAAAANSSDRIAHQRAPRRNGHRGEAGRSRHELEGWRGRRGELRAVRRARALESGSRRAARGRERRDEGGKASCPIFPLGVGREKGTEELVRCDGSGG